MQRLQKLQSSALAMIGRASSRTSKLSPRSRESPSPSPRTRHVKVVAAAARPNAIDAEEDVNGTQLPGLVRVRPAATWLPLVSEGDAADMKEPGSAEAPPTTARPFWAAGGGNSGKRLQYGPEDKPRQYRRPHSYSGLSSADRAKELSQKPRNSSTWRQEDWRRCQPGAPVVTDAPSAHSSRDLNTLRSELQARGVVSGGVKPVKQLRQAVVTGSARVHSPSSDVSDGATVSTRASSSAMSRTSSTVISPSLVAPTSKHVAFTAQHAGSPAHALSVEPKALSSPSAQAKDRIQIGYFSESAHRCGRKRPVPPPVRTNIVA